MDNQHRKISGYRDLSQEEIDLVNQIKQIGNEIGALHVAILERDITDRPKQDLEIAEHHLKTGLMWLTRAITQPSGFQSRLHQFDVIK